MLKCIMASSHLISDAIDSGPLKRRTHALPVFALDEVAKLLEQRDLTEPDIADNEIYPVYQYWNDVRGERIAPTRREIKLDELPPKLVPAIAIIDFVDDPIDYYYRFFGTSLVQVSGMELTGKRYFADNIQGYGFVNEKLLPILIERKAPLFNSVIWQSIRGIEYETTAIRLPFSDDGQKITGAMTVNSWAKSH